MRIGAGITQSLNVARAYGVPVPRAVAPVKPGLIAGTVDGKVEFGGPAAPSAAASAFRMYTRSADVNEVATAVTIGRTIDVAG